MEIILIAAIGKNNELGLGNNLIWHLPKDLNFFYNHTVGKTIVMGKNTFFSLPKMLPKRQHIVLTNTDEIYPNDVIIAHTTKEVLDRQEDELIIIGGAYTYQEFIPYATKMYLTQIEASSKADVYFPKFDKKDWKITILDEEIENNLKYQHVLYERK
ncbi:MAG: dihydrofolate reductase [Bacilli bacterium]